MARRLVRGCAALVAFVGLALGCSRSNVPAQCADEDGDGYSVCSPKDCDDKDPTVYPNAPPGCDGKDHDCDGAPDQSALACASGEACVGTRCLPTSCGDNPCRAGEGCLGGECVDASCVNLTCAPGERCASGACYPKRCADESCGPSEVCHGGACVDSRCLGVICAEGQVCADGRCLQQSCVGVLCAEGAACVDGVCVATDCIGKVCPAETLCILGQCLPTRCGEQPCPTGQVCLEGLCSDSRCVGLSCPDGTRCENAACVACPGGLCCNPMDPPASCGVPGSECTQACQANGTPGACQPPSGPVDVLSDPAHCGQCGNACPAPVHATPLCVQGACGRGPCEPGYFDLDGPATFGCESTCDGSSCTGPDGGSWPVDAPPPPEVGPVWAAFSSGASVGAEVQTSPGFINYGVLGEAVVGDGAATMSSPTYRNIGGFVSGVW